MGQDTNRGVGGCVLVEKRRIHMGKVAVWGKGASLGGCCSLRREMEVVNRERGVENTQDSGFSIWKNITRT